MRTPTLPFHDIDQRFKRIFLACVLFYAALALIINLIQVPPRERTDFSQLPPRIARLIIESAKPQPPPTLPPQTQQEKKEEPKPAESEKPKAEEPIPAPQEVAKKEVPTGEEIRAQQEAQRKKNIEIAMNSGLLKLLKQPQTQAELNGLQDTKLKKAFSDIKSLHQAPRVITSTAVQAPSAPVAGIDDIVAKLQKSIQESNPAVEGSAVTGSGGIGALSGDLSADIGGTALKERKTAAVESPFQIKGGDDGKSPRSHESIAQVVDSYKGGISFIYNRALRENPALRGTITIEFIIAPNGDVVDCRVVSSSMSHPAFEEAVVKRVLQWKFPQVSGGNVTVTYPIVFSVAG